MPSVAEQDALPFVPVRPAPPTATNGVLRAEVVFPGLLPRPVPHGFFPVPRLHRRRLADGPVLVFGTLDDKDRWPDVRDAAAAPPSWAKVVEGNWLILRRSLVQPLLAGPIARGEVELRPAWLGRALARRNGSVDPTKGRLDDDWVWLDVKARMPLDRDAVDAVCFAAPAGLASASADATRRHASRVTCSSGPARWHDARSPRFDIFRVGEWPASVYVSQRLRRALDEVFGEGLVTQRATYFDELAGSFSAPAFAQDDAASRASAEAFWRIYAAEGRGSPADRALAVTSPVYAYWLAMLVDRGPSDETRNGALGHPVFAVAYARDVDRGPRDDTRSAATDGNSLLDYVRDVDGAVHPDVRARIDGYAALKLRDAEMALKAEADLLATPDESPHALMEAAEAARETPTDKARTTKTTKTTKATTGTTGTTETTKATTGTTATTETKGTKRTKGTKAKKGETTTTTTTTSATLPAPVVLGLASVRHDGACPADLVFFHPDQRFAPGPWVFRVDRLNKTLRRNFKKTGSIGATVLQAGVYAPFVFRRSLVAPILADIPTRDLTLRPVRVVDDEGVLDDDFVALDIHARFPLDRGADGLDFVDPARPHDTVLRTALRFCWSAERTPRAALFRVAEFPWVVMVSPDLLARLRAALGKEIVAFSGVPTYARATPAFALAEDSPPPGPLLPEDEARAAADAFFALARGAADNDLRTRALSHPYWAYWVADVVDGAARPDTRAAALRDPCAAAFYARFVDGALRDDTRAAVQAWAPARGYVTGRLEPPEAAVVPAVVAAVLPPYVPTPDAARAARRRLVLDASAAAPGTPRLQRPDAAVIDDLDVFAERGLSLLGVADDAAPAVIAARVHAFIDDVRKGSHKIPRGDPDSIALQLSVVWGCQLARALGWRWASVSYDAGASLGLVSPDRAHATFPLAVIQRALVKKSSNTTLLLFNMLVDGNVPPSTPGACAPLG
jgi:hypothetical protein